MSTVAIGTALRTMVIVNPTSGAGANGRRWRRTARALRQALGSFEHAFSERPLHASELARRALHSGYEMIVAVGGDGTLNEVVGGFFEAGRPVAPQAVLGVVALGTGSDFARTLGRPGLDEACARLAGRDSRLVDVGHARFTGHDGALRERVFLNVASFGCSGLVARLVSPRLKRASGALAFTLATVRALATFRDQPVSISIDGGATLDYSITNCAFCNARFFGAGVQVAPAAQIDDGRFDVTLWSGFGLVDFIRKHRSLYNGTHVTEPGTRLLTACRARADSPAIVLFELDGESVGRLPVEIRILPHALRLKV